jgi:uncharacterized membrane protein YfcA
MTTAQLIGACIAVFVGSATQSIVGFGMNLIAVPVVLLIGAEELVPGPLIVCLFVQAWTLVIGEHEHAHRELLRWFLPVRVVGTVAGLGVAVALSGDATSIVICVLVLGAVALSMSGWRVPARPGPWMATGFASGFSNVLSSIGGPPLSLAMADDAPPVQRATQGWSAIFGSLMSMVILGLAHRFGVVDIRRGLVLVPMALAGSYVIRPLRRHLPTADTLRPFVWTVAVVGSLATIGRAIVL